MRSSHPTSCDCGSLVADGAVAFWVLWEWPSQGSWESFPQVQAQQLSISSPEMADKPPNHFQTLKPGTHPDLERVTM